MFHTVWQQKGPDGWYAGKGGFSPCMCEVVGEKKISRTAYLAGEKKLIRIREVRMDGDGALFCKIIDLCAVLFCVVKLCPRFDL